MLIQVWLVGSDSVFDAALRRLPEGYLVRALADWSEVISALRAEGADPVVVFDPYGETGELDPGMLGVRAEFPSVALVAAMHVDSRSAGDVLTLGEWGVASILTRALDTGPVRMEQRIREARHRAALQSVLRALPSSPSPRARPLLEAALGAAVAGCGVATLSERLYLSGRTLQRRMGRAGLPAPRQVIAWMRTLVAARLLDDPGRSANSAAQAAGYASYAALHRAFQRVRLPSPGTARSHGSVLSAAARAFAASARTPPGAA